MNASDLLDAIRSLLGDGQGDPSAITLSGSDPQSLTLPTGGLGPLRLPALLAAIGQKEVAKSLPSGFDPSVDVYLERLEVSTGSMFIGLNAPGARFELLPGLTVAAPSLTIGVTGPSFMGRIGATVAMGNIELQVGVELPLLVARAALAPNADVSLAPLLERFQLSAHGFESLTIDRFALEIDVPAQTQRLGLGVEGKWSTGVSFDLEQADLDLVHRAGAGGGYDVSLSGTVQVGSTPLTLSAQHHGHDSGWQLAGSAQPNESLNDAANAIGELFGHADLGGKLPAAVATEVSLTSLGLEFNTQTKSFSFHCQGSYQSALAATTTATIDLAVNLAPQPAGGYEKHFDGKLVLGKDPNQQLELDLVFDKDATQPVFVANYSNPGGGKLTLSSLIPGVPSSFKVKDLLFAHEPGSYLFAAAMDMGLDLSGLAGLPLIGKLLPAHEALRLGFVPVYSSSTAPDLSKLQDLIPDGAPPLPKTLTGNGFQLLTTLHMGDDTKRLTLPGADGSPSLDPDKKALSSTLGSPQVQPQSDPQPDPGAALGAQDPHKDIKWIDLQKHFGPLHFQRLGIGYQSEKLQVLLDAALALGPLDIALMGLGAEYDLEHKKLSFSLDGMGIDFRRGPLEIGAAFLRFGADFAGKAILRTETLTIGALGAYGKHPKQHGHPSLFIYAFIDYPIGGPAFFFVEGLAAGFGYNRRLIVPPIAQIHTFPLVAEVIGKAPAAPKLTEGDPSAAMDGVRTEIATLERYIPPDVGQYFLAVGLKFNTFKLIDCFALLALSVGKHFEIDLLGVATLIVPTPEEGESVEPLAEVEMEFSARFEPLEGFLGLQAQLTPNSFILSRQCHLQGGFAFYAWMLGPHAGQFVYTMGGYHPKFHRPKYYPVVPRVGFNWSVSSELSIKGDAYYALTSTAVMAGGYLGATWESGDLKAWFDLGADFLMSWKPYHYEADAYVEIGAAVTVHFFGTHHVTIHAGADLELWGPDFAGVAHIRVKVLCVHVHFTVDFGDSSRSVPPISWSKFQSSFLPAVEQRCSLALAAGLVATHKKGSTEHWIVNPKELVIATDSVIPSKTGSNDEAGTAAANIAAGTALEVGGARTDIGVAPMGLAELQTSEHRIRITREKVNWGKEFSFRPVLKRFPAAMWGNTADAGKQLNDDMIEGLAGYEIRPALPAKPSTTRPIERSELAFEIATPRVQTKDPTPPATLEPPQPTEGNTATLGSLLADPTSAARRSDLLAAFHFDSVTAVRLDDTLEESFVLAPTIVEMA